MKVVTFKIDEELLQKIDLIAINSRLSRSDVIREAVEYYLKSAGRSRAWTKEL